MMVSLVREVFRRKSTSSRRQTLKTLYSLISCYLEMRMRLTGFVCEDDDMLALVLGEEEQGMVLTFEL